MKHQPTIFRPTYEMAAGTSTGGITNKRYGRVGDSPLIGTGTYTDNNTVAVSATGSGEKFIRTATAYNIASQVKFNKAPLATAAANALNEVKPLMAVAESLCWMLKATTPCSLNTVGMYRGAIGNDGKKEIALFGE
ncbi:isoaspartyl peptidase/L-asparaginase [Aeromonas enteropelogenes]|uniref:isoaspartyl peptidase/L-asparaginase n=1 Tax=Aeromonas enteropelogenes TaxID=29489 RepID=UPI003B9E7A4D